MQIKNLCKYRSFLVDKYPIIFSWPVSRRHHWRLIIILLLHIILLPILFIIAFSIIYSIIAILEYNIGLALAKLWQIIAVNLLPPAILVLSILVFVYRNPIYALICLILLFLSTALFLISLRVEFLAMIYLIIYIGAIAILFLFVIMMFNLRELLHKSKKVKDDDFLYISFSIYIFVISKFVELCVIAFKHYAEYNLYLHKIFSVNYFFLHTWTENYYKFFIQDLIAIWENVPVIMSSPTANLTDQLDFIFSTQYIQTQDIWIYSNVFYTYYIYVFILAGLILLTAMVGAIILALSTTEKALFKSSIKDQKLLVK